MQEALLAARLEAAKNLSKVNVEAVASAEALAATYDAKLAAAREDLEAKQKAELQTVDDAKAADIQASWQKAKAGGSIVAHNHLRVTQSYCYLDFCCIRGGTLFGASVSCQKKDRLSCNFSG